MAISIKHPEADRLARQLSEATGETLTEAILNALRERLEHQRAKRPAPQSTHQILAEARLRLAGLPVRDHRSADEILGYDEHGLPR